MATPTTTQVSSKRLLMLIGGILIVAFAAFKLFLSPYQENKLRLNFVDNERQNKQREFMTFLRDRKRLERDRLVGLPRDLDHARSEYTRYLQKLLDDCGFAREEVTPSTTVTQASAFGGQTKKAGHIGLSFQVRATGTWASLVKFMDRFQKTPLLHRLKTWNAEEPKDKSEGKLGVSMTIEALVVNGSDKRPDHFWGVDPRLTAMDAMLALYGQPAGWSLLLRGQALLVPERPQRRYDDLVRVNPFSLYSITELLAKDKAKKDAQARVEADKKKKAAELTKKKPPPQIDFRLVLIGDEKAILMAAENPEKHSPIKLSSARVFQIAEGKKATVLRIDPRDVYVQVGTAIYGIHIGQELTEALKKPLSRRELDGLGLSGKIGSEPPSRVDLPSLP